MNDYAKYIGVPWKSGGRDIDNSLDCWGLVWHIYNNIYQINIPSLEHIHIANGESVTRKQIAEVSTNILSAFDCIDVKKEPLKEGDIIFINHNNLPLHVAVALDDNKMIHTLEKINCVVEDFRSNRWINKIESVRRFKDFN